MPLCALLWQRRLKQAMRMEPIVYDVRSAETYDFGRRGCVYFLDPDYLVAHPCDMARIPITMLAGSTGVYADPESARAEALRQIRNLLDVEVLAAEGPIDLNRVCVITDEDGNVQMTVPFRDALQ
jgi:hypothetical protein